MYRKHPAAELLRDWQAYALPEPWRHVTPEEAASLVRELERELGASHPLKGRNARALARRNDRDDVLFVATAPAELALVHLTYVADAPDRPPWPQTRFYGDAHAFVDSLHSEARGRDANE